MKRFVLFVICLSVLTVAQAQVGTIGYVDMRKVLTENKAGQRLKAELEKSVKSRKDALAKEEEKLKALQQAYEKDKLLLSENQRQEKQKDFQQKVEAYQKQVTQAQRELSQKESEYAKKAVPEIRAIIRELAQEEKLMLVFEKSEVPLYAAEGPDLTDKVLARYNKSQK